MRTRSRRGSSLVIGCVLAVYAVACASAGPASAALPDGRAWELVPPTDKNGGQVDPPGSIAAGGVLQAAAQGSAITYSSRASFGEPAGGAPPASQYLASRTSGGWASLNITAPLLSGTYGFIDEGVPYQLFSPDLARGLLFDGNHCRGGASGCAVDNPPLYGTDAPDGYQNYYLWEGGSFTSVLAQAQVAGRSLDPADFDLRFAGASPDLSTIVVWTCAALTAGAADGCGEERANVYAWSRASRALTLINTAPGAALASQATTVSVGGSRIYWKDLQSGNLYLHQGSSNTQVDEAAGGGGNFEVAGADGAVAYFTKQGHLWRYANGNAIDLTPAGGVVGVLGGGENGGIVYFQDSTGLKAWKEGSTSTVASGAAAADASTYPPATGAARVSADGTKLLFVSKAQLTGYDNTDKVSGLPDTEVYLYDGNTQALKCLSCNPSGRRPIGPSTIPGAYPNGSAPGSTDVYKPRALSLSGRRVFFDSADSLVAGDSNSKPATGAGVPDVYQWEASGEGSCGQSGGCLDLISSGSLPQSAGFADASADGTDAYFLTDASLVGSDPGSGDLYDARVGGGFPEPSPPIPCEGDACQLLPPVPFDPTVTTRLPGSGNPPVIYHKYCRKGYVKRKGICVKRGRHHHRKHKKRKHR